MAASRATTKKSNPSKPEEADIKPEDQEEKDVIKEPSESQAASVSGTPAAETKETKEERDRSNSAELQAVKFLEPWSAYAVDDIAAFKPDIASKLIANEIAEEVAK